MLVYDLLMTRYVLVIVMLLVVAVCCWTRGTNVQRMVWTYTYLCFSSLSTNFTCAVAFDKLEQLIVQLELRLAQSCDTMRNSVDFN